MNYNTTISSGSVLTQDANVPKQDTVSSCLDRISSMLNDMSGFEGRLIQIGDRIGGGEPRPSEGKALQAQYCT